MLTLLFCAPAYSMADDVPVSAYRIKAAFLYNFSRFVIWPESTGREHDSFSVCVLGDDPFGETLDTLEGKKVHELELTVKRIRNPALVTDCPLVYITLPDAGQRSAALSMLRELPVLTVSDFEDFTEQGGIIRFKLMDNKIRFDINIEAARTANLSISSKLLSLATVVGETR